MDSKTKKPLIYLYFDIKLTSLSPDSQPISLGIVSDDIHKQVGSVRVKGGYSAAIEEIKPKQFYAEFNDFDINRCDDWVKENIIKKLNIPKENDGHLFFTDNPDDYRVIGSTYLITTSLRQWLEQFKDYNIQFVADCGTFDWYWILQLIGEWETYNYYPFRKYCDLQKRFFKDKSITVSEYQKELIDIPYGERGDDISAILYSKTKKELSDVISRSHKTGLPKLPKNISPIPQDLNDLIAYKKGIGIREAFELDREDLLPSNEDGSIMGWGACDKHNSAWDAWVTKMIFNNLK